MLSDREKVVLERLLEGKRYKHIARELGIAESTVGTEVRMICAKLDCPNRLAAAVKWAELKKLR